MSQRVAAASKNFAGLLLMLLLSALNAAAQQRSTDGLTPVGLSPGAPAGGSSLSGFDDINLFNGDLKFSLPLLTVSGRGGARHTLTLPINRRWVVNHRLIDPVNDIFAHNAEDDWWSGFDLARYSPGRLIGRQTNDGGCRVPGAQVTGTMTRLTFVGPDGAEYDFRDTLSNGGDLRGFCTGGGFGPSRGTVFVTFDGSAATFISDTTIHDEVALSPWKIHPSGHLLFRDGTRHRIYKGKVIWARDRNGNQITFAYDELEQPWGRVVKITDSLGREVHIHRQSAPNGAPVSDEITYKGLGGADRTIRVEYADLGSALRAGPGGYTLKMMYELFGLDNGDFVYNPRVPASVLLPDGVSRYRFYYNSHGELARVELPTGGAYEYDWGATLQGGAPSGVVTVQTTADATTRGWPEIYRRVLARRVMSAGNVVEGVTTYSQTQGQGTATSAVTVDYRKPDGQVVAREKHYFHGNPVPRDETNPLGWESWQAGREYQTEAFDADGQTLLRRATHTWALAHGNPSVTDTVTTLADANLVSKQSFAYDQFNNRTDVWEYDFGSGSAPAHAARHTHTDYLTANPANGIDYTSHSGAHIRNLPRAVQVYAVNPQTGAETLAAQGETLYDEPSYAPLPYGGGVTGWDDPGTAARGLATTTRRWLDTANTWLEAHAQYDQLGNVRNAWDARGNLSSVSYSDSFSDGVGRNAYAFPTATTSAVPDPTGNYGSSSALTTSTVYDFSSGLPVSTTDANDKTTSLSYAGDAGNLDPFDRLMKVSRPDGGWTKYDYGRNQWGDYVHTRVLLDAAGAESSSYDYTDGLGRPSRSFRYENQDPANPWLTADTAYDALGRVRKVSAPYRSTGANSAPFPGDRWTEKTYDALSRVTEVRTLPDGARVLTAYSGNSVTVTDQAGRRKRSLSDALGRLTRVDEPDAETGELDRDGAPVQPTHYGYDAAGNLRRVEQGGQQRFFMYDSLGRLVRAKNPEQATNAGLALADPVTGNSQWSLAYGYDANGNLTTRADARGVTTTYSYDALNRNTLVSYSDGTPGVKRVYDTAVNGRGRFRADWTWDGNNTYYTHRAVDNYDAAGRPLDSRQYFTDNRTGTAFTASVTYNLAGAVTSQTYPSGQTVSYSYDAAGRLSGFTGNLGGEGRTYSSQVLYDPSGGMSQERFGTDTPLYHKRHYNSRGQLYDIRLSTVSLATNQWDWNRGAIINYYSSNYAWEGDPSTPASADNNGNLRRQQHWVPADDAISTYSYAQQTYGYDTLNRLKSVAEARGTPAGAGGQELAQAYDYNRWGNRTISAEGTWAGQPSNPPNHDLVNERQFDKGDLQYTNRLYAPGDTALPAGQRLMRYDAAGNLTYDAYTGAGVRSYDAENRMVSAQAGGGQSAAYAYDADGRRVKRLVGTAGEVWQVYGLGGELLAEYAKGAPTNSPRKEYGYRDGGLLVTAEAAGGWGPAPTFTDEGLAGRWVQALYVTELRQAIDSLRAKKGLAAYQWREVAAPRAPITAESFLELRRALDGALGAPAGGYTPGLEPKKAIRAVFLEELRERVLGAWQAGAAGADVRWLVADHLDTPRMVVDKTGGLAGVSRHDYLPFGEELLAGTSGRATTHGYGAVDNVRQKFTGYEHDGETNLDYAQARYFASVQGRFMSPDPALSSGKPLEPQSWNRYAYCINNPLMFTDPSGLVWGMQYGYNGRGERIAMFKWFDGKVDEAAGWKQYNNEYFVGSDEVVWFNHKEPDAVTLSKANFSDEEFASLRSADPSNFTPEQQKVLRREMADAAWANKGPFIKFTAGLAGGAAGSAGAASGFTFGAAGRQAERLPPVLFGYTSEQTAATIMRNRTFGPPDLPLYLTNNGSLSPLQAQLELALPPHNTARALFAIDSQALSRSSLLLSRRVTGNVYSRPGGGFEFMFKPGTTVPGESFTRFRF